MSMIVIKNGISLTHRLMGINGLKGLPSIVPRMTIAHFSTIHFVKSGYTVLGNEKSTVLGVEKFGDEIDTIMNVPIFLKVSIGQILFIGPIRTLWINQSQWKGIQMPGKFHNSTV